MPARLAREGDSRLHRISGVVIFLEKRQIVVMALPIA